MDEIWYVEPDAVMKEAARSPYEKTEMTEHPGTGHRQRVRDRFVKENGLDSFQEHEVLEMLLFYAKPRGDTKGIAKDLLENFGNLKGVLEARPEQLQTVKGVGESQAVFISMMLPLTRYCQKMEMTNPKQIANRHDLEAYCKSMLMGRRVEEFHVICVDAQCRVLGTRRVSEGSLSEVNAYPRLVMESALAYNAHSVFFCHNPIRAEPAGRARRTLRRRCSCSGR